MINELGNIELIRNQIPQLHLLSTRSNDWCLIESNRMNKPLLIILAYPILFILVSYLLLLKSRRISLYSSFLVFQTCRETQTPLINWNWRASTNTARPTLLLIQRQNNTIISYGGNSPLDRVSGSLTRNSYVFVVFLSSNPSFSKWINEKCPDTSLPVHLKCQAFRSTNFQYPIENSPNISIPILSLRKK